MCVFLVPTCFQINKKNFCSVYVEIEKSNCWVAKLICLLFFLGVSKSCMYKSYLSLPLGSTNKVTKVSLTILTLNLAYSDINSHFNFERYIDTLDLAFNDIGTLVLAFSNTTFSYFLGQRYSHLTFSDIDTLLILALYILILAFSDIDTLSLK